MRLALYIKIILLLLSGTIHSQQARQYAFTHFTTANGLASNFVYSITQDKDGFLWLATVNGLQRYDGYRFLTFRSGRHQPSGLPVDEISKLYYDKKGALWLLMPNNQIGIFNTRTFTFTPVPIEGPDSPQNGPVTIWEDYNGELLVQEVNKPIYRYHAPENKMVLYKALNPVPDGWRCNKIIWDKQLKRYWAAADSGLVLYDPVTQKQSYRNHNIENNDAIRKLGDVLNVLELHVSSAGNLSLMNWPPRTGNPFIYHYNRQTGEASQHNLITEMGLGYHEIGGFLEQKNGRIWVSGRPFLAEWLPQQKKFEPIANEYRNEQSIRFDQVSAWHEDAESNIWIGTDNGLYFFNPDAQKFNNYFVARPGDAKVKEGPVHALLQTKDSNILVGTWSIGLFYYDKNLNPIPLPPSLRAMQHELSVWDMHQHSQTGKIWIVLQAGGVVVYDPATGIAQREFPPIFNARTIRQIAEDKEGNLWFGTQGGMVIKWDYKKAPKDIKNNYQLVTTTGLVHALEADNRGNIWVASLSQGLVQLDARTGKLIYTYKTSGPEGKTIISNSPSDILQYNDSTLIVVANGLNLINLNNSKIKYITTAEGLPTNSAYCVQKDKDGVLWIGMANGLCRVNLQKITFVMYDRRDGIAHDNFVKNGAFTLSGNRLAFTTDHNFITFNTNNFISSREAPPVPKFTAIRLANKALPVDSLLQLKKLSLGYTNSSVSIEFSGLNFLKEKQPVYYYKMQGLDKHWLLADGNNAAIYNHLPPGDYVFLVESRNQDGVFSQSPAQLQIEVTPPFWRTWWFYALITLLVITLLYIFDKERVARLRSLQSVRSEIAGNLHEEINITLNDINLLSEIAKLKADKDIDRSKDYIDQISNKSRSMIESMDDMLWSIDPQNDSMEKLLMRLKQYTEGFNNTYGTHIELTADKNVQQLQMDMKCRYEFMHFFKEALNYAIQQSACSTLYIGMEYAKPKLYLKILAQCVQVQTEDVEAQQSRREMEKRADLLQGALEVMEDKKSISIILQFGV